MATRAKQIPGVNRVGMMVRIAPHVREQIEAAAASSGRSLGQKVELRLSRSFDADLIQKAVADGIAAHEAAKREELMKRVTVHSSGVYGVNQSISSGNSYLSLYGIQSAQNS